MKNKKTVWIVVSLVLIVSLCCILVSCTAVILFFRNLWVNDKVEASDLMNEMCDYVGDGEYEKAYNLQSDGVKRQTSVEDFEKLELFYKDCKSITINGIRKNLSTDIITLEGIAYFDDGSRGTFRGAVVEEDGELKAYSFYIGRDTKDLDDYMILDD